MPLAFIFARSAVAPLVRLARGIVAEPPAKWNEAGDGADSPTRAAEGGEAARPKKNIINKKYIFRNFARKGVV